MLRSNSKKAIENIQAYIINNFDGTNYGIETPETFKETAKIILDTFRHEKFYSDSYERKHGITEQSAFIDWCAGLPSILDTCYYYNRSAVDDLASILEESESEKAQYNESAAETMLSKLIYRELRKIA